MPDLVVPNIMFSDTETTRYLKNNMRVLLKSVLINLRLHTRENFFACTLVTVRAICRALSDDNK